MKILNHPNIGEFRREHAAAFFDSSANCNSALRVRETNTTWRCRDRSSASHSALGEKKKTCFGVFFHLHHSVMSHTPTSRDTLMKAEEFAETCQGNKILKDL